MLCQPTLCFIQDLPRNGHGAGFASNTVPDVLDELEALSDGQLCIIGRFKHD
jgi:hypothetical protein